MIFNSIDFAVFLPLVFAFYWIIGSGRVTLQNWFITFASYVFYGWWDEKFLLLILASTIADFYIGRKLTAVSGRLTRQYLLFASLLINLGLLAYFKYANFFIENFTTAFTLFGGEFRGDRLDIILPVGISFYTFQTLSYTIDVYRGKLKPTRNFIEFAAYVSFFPQLVAGPIERATNLLPQFSSQRTFNYKEAVLGMRQIIWGLFKKMVIADNCALLVNTVFDSPGDYSGSTLAIGVVLFSFQIYADFSGYSDIAIGTARLFGFRFENNFAYPYFSRSIGEFWRRWHISLSTWFRDYLYIPLGGSRGTIERTIANTFIIFLVSGFWHGAAWTFILWGLLHAVFFLPSLISAGNRRHLDTVASGRILPSLREVGTMLKTFVLVTLAWVLFRAESTTDAFVYYSGLFSSSLFSVPEVTGLGRSFGTFSLIIFMITIEWVGRNDNFALQKSLNVCGKSTRLAFYYGLCILIGLFAVSAETPFIYFQF